MPDTPRRGRATARRRTPTRHGHATSDVRGTCRLPTCDDSRLMRLLLRPWCQVRLRASVCDCVSELRGPCTVVGIDRDPRSRYGYRGPAPYFIRSQ